VHANKAVQNTAEQNKVGGGGVSHSNTNYRNTKKNLAKNVVSGQKNVFSGRPVDG